MLKNIGVIGAGQMGSGIAQIAASNQCKVFLFDVSEQALKNAQATIQKSLEKLVQKNLLSQENASDAFRNLQTTADINTLKKGLHFVIEAATENIDIKGKIFKTLSDNLDPQTILCSNTSSLPITQLATYTDRPEKFMGMHFMNPVPLMELVEVIPGLQTSSDTLTSVLSLAEQMKKTTSLSKDYPGFIANRILMPMINEAIFVLYEHIADVESIDKTMKLGMNHPMGPLLLADFIGLDTVLYILHVLYDGFKDTKFRPCPLLVQLVHAGQFGRKNKMGFYDYSSDKPKARKF